MSGQIRSWRELTGRTQAWSGDWVAVHQTKLGRGPVRRRREKALTLLGFRELAPGFSIRPDNLRGGVAALRARLGELASPSSAAIGDSAEIGDASGRVFLARDFDPTSDLEARSLWDADALAREARDSTVRLRESADEIAGWPIEEAMVETFLVGGGVLRQLLRHPLLPAEILDPEPLATLLAEMKRYDELGRACWAPFLARHEVPHRALPLDSRRSAQDLVPAPHLGPT
jgi:phenylacetic acid degradation operon negative regulatory protein